MEECVDGEYQTFKANDGAFVREHFFGKYPETRGDGRRLDGRRDLGAPPRRSRPAEGLRGLPRRRAPHGPADRDPREDDQGLRDGRGGRGPQHHPPAEGDERGGATRDPRPARDPAHRRGGDRRVLPPPARGQPRAPLPRRAPAELGGSLPARHADAEPLPTPRAVHDRARGQRRARELDHDGVRPHPQLARARRDARASAWCRSCPTSRGRSGWRGCSGSSASTPRSASSTSPRTPGTSCTTARTSDGQILQEGINEPGAFSSWIAAATVVREPRRRDDPVLHLLFDVRLPAGRRPRVGGRRQPRARLPGRRHRRPDDAQRRGAAARGRPLARPRVGDPELRRVRPDLRVRAARDRPRGAPAHVSRSRRTSSTTSP